MDDDVASTIEKVLEIAVEGAVHGPADVVDGDAVFEGDVAAQVKFFDVGAKPVAQESGQFSIYIADGIVGVRLAFGTVSMDDQEGHFWGNPRRWKECYGHQVLFTGYTNCSEPESNLYCFALSFLSRDSSSR